MKSEHVWIYKWWLRKYAPQALSFLANHCMQPKHVVEGLEYDPGSWKEDLLHFLDETHSAIFVVLFGGDVSRVVEDLITHIQELPEAGHYTNPEKIVLSQLKNIQYG